MTTKEIKSWFNRGYNINKELIQLEKAKENAFNLACSVVASNDGDRVQNSSKNSSEEKFIKYAEYSRELDIHKTQLLIIQAEIFEAINTVDDNVLRAILMARYINFDKWEQIALDISCDKRWTFRLHNKALKLVGNKIDH